LFPWPFLLYKILIIVTHYYIAIDAVNAVFDIFLIIVTAIHFVFTIATIFVILKQLVTDDFKMEKIEEMISMNDITELFGVTRQSVHRWIKHPDFPKPFKIVGKLLWKRSEIEAYIESTRKPRE
jgi:predicted DNA-binding transcriptional regulator AlpA